MVAVLDRPAVVGSQVPRIRVVPDGVDHPRWQEIREFVACLPLALDPWQLEVLRVALMRTRDLARWAAFSVAVCAPRQNGKNAILEARELVGALLLDEKLVIHTAHLADTSKESFRRLEDLIDANDLLAALVKHVWRTNGHESVEFWNGNRIRFRTRTRGGGRGFAGTPVVFDEPMFLPEVSMGSILPVISAQPDPQVWYTGSAVDQTLHEDGVVFARVRERALRGEDPRLAYFEWSLEGDSPDEVETPADPAGWAATNPALGIRITPEYVEAEQREFDPRTFAVERLGVGDWPPTSAVAAAVIDLGVWAALEDVDSRPLDPVTLAFDVAPDRRSASICAAGAREDGLAHVEVIDHRRGTGWVPERLLALREAHRPARIICDGRSPAASLLQQLEALGVEVETVTASEHASACGRLYDLVSDAGLRHLGTDELRHALQGAATRPLGEAWAWSRRSSAVDISPLVACTLALWGSGEADPAGEVVIGWGKAA